MYFIGIVMLILHRHVNLIYTWQLIAAVVPTIGTAGAALGPMTLRVCPELKLL